MNEPSIVVDQPPRLCPSCGQDLSEHPYYQLVPARPARVLRKIAMGLMPAMGVAYLVFLFWGRTDLGFGTGHGYLALAMIGGPSLLVYAVSGLLPKLHLVICQRCSWNHEYPDSRSILKKA